MADLRPTIAPMSAFLPAHFVRSIRWRAAMGALILLAPPLSKVAAQEAAIVQIGALRTPTAAADGQRTDVFVTLFLEVPDLKAAAAACARQPQLRDAYVRLTQARPFPSLGRMVDSAALEGDIAAAFDKFLGAGTVREVFAMAGTPIESAGPMTRALQREAKSAPPEGRSVRPSGEDCRPIRALPPDAAEQMRAQHPRRLAAAQAAKRSTGFQGGASAAGKPAPVGDQPFEATSPWFWVGFVGVLAVMFGGAGLIYLAISRHRALVRRQRGERRAAATDRRQADRRKSAEPSYTGPERRQGDRRAGPRRAGADRRAGEDRRQ